MTVRRIGVFVIGLVLIVCGVFMQLAQSDRLTGAPTSVAVVVRPDETGTSGWRVVPANEAKKIGDVDVQFMFQVSRTPRSRKSVMPSSWSVLAGMTVQPPSIAKPDGQSVDIEQGLLEHRVKSMLADEVQARTGIPEYAKAVRNVGTSIEIERGAKWLAWGMLIAGAIACVIAAKWESW